MGNMLETDSRIGTTVAGYRIERLLGRGGMSTVYLAEDPALGRSVALKLLSPELSADERFRERFRLESRLAASIDHPNVIPIYWAGLADDGTLFIAMRYVEGADLKRVLRAEGALELPRALEFLSQVARGLDADRARGLVHRDVKPSNVLIAHGEDDREHVYSADFGPDQDRDLFGGGEREHHPIGHDRLRQPRADPGQRLGQCERRLRPRLSGLRVSHRRSALPGARRAGGESQELFEEFGKTLIPILSELGVDPGEPQVAEVHNVIQG